MIDRFKKAEVLYIDDLFKTGRNPDGSEPKPTAADINAAFEIINYRYNNPALLTIISSELNEDELLDIDEAVGGRIFERSKSISIAKKRPAITSDSVTECFLDIFSIDNPSLFLQYTPYFSVCQYFFIVFR